MAENKLIRISVTTRNGETFHHDWPATPQYREEVGRVMLEVLSTMSSGGAICLGNPLIAGNPRTIYPVDWVAMVQDSEIDDN